MSSPYPELPTGGADHCETKVYSPIGRQWGIQVLLLYKEPRAARRLEGSECWITTCAG